MECELHRVPLELKDQYNERDVAMVTPSIEYLLNARAFPRHTPFFYSDTKLADSQQRHMVNYCPKCDIELTALLKGQRE
jgi:hypothetical protein